MDDYRNPIDLTDEDVKDAMRRLDGNVRRTPILNSPILNAHIDFELFVKAESLQNTGSFKFRGATNATSRVSESGFGKGVIAASSGNHASAIAAAANRFDLAATVVIPNDTPKKKLDIIKHFGADTVPYEKLEDDRDAIVAQESIRRNAAIVNSSDDMNVIAGQATVGLEIVEQVSDLGVDLDYLIVPCGGGGLAAGCAWAFAKHSQNTKVVVVEPAGFDDMARSLASRERVFGAESEASVCDGLLHKTPSALPFSMLLDRVDHALSVPDEETLKAMVTAFNYYNLVLEPNGAIAMAAAMMYRDRWAGKKVAVIASGGNVDAKFFGSVLNSSLPAF
jgi:threonine dehydratase